MSHWVVRNVVLRINDLPLCSLIHGIGYNSPISEQAFIERLRQTPHSTPLQWGARENAGEKGD